MRKKIIYVVLDGLGDLPHPKFCNQTPLELADAKFMNEMAKIGRTGLMYSVGKGIAPESDVAVISILGYDAQKYYTGRGPLECYASGLEMRKGDLAYRVNFATLGENGEIFDRRVGRNLTTQEATGLAEEINQKVKLENAQFWFKNTIGHRGVLLIRDNKIELSAKVNNTDPAYEQQGVFSVAKEKFENFVQLCAPQKGFENQQTLRAAQLTNEFIKKSSEVLKNSEINKKRILEGKLPANVILTRDGGDRLPEFPSMKEKYNLNFACFVEMPVERGIALLTGMEIIQLPELTGNPQIDYQKRAEIALDKIEEYDALYIHLKGPDEPAHDGDFLKKVEIIQQIDKFFFGQIIEKIDLSDKIIIVTADHSTPCILKSHSDDPVPLLIVGDGIKPDNSIKFTEKECKNGNIGVLKGVELLPLVVKMI